MNNPVYLNAPLHSNLMFNFLAMKTVRILFELVTTYCCVIHLYNVT
jgi:hypothetical protein